MIIKREFIKTGLFDIAYRQWGTEGKAVVLLHGIPTNSILWNKTGEYLAENGYRVFAPELLGLGYTKGPMIYDHSFLGQSKIINSFIEKVVRDDYILVGHDLGGGIAQILLTEYPANISKCVLTNCVAFDSWPIKEIKFLIKIASRDNYAQTITPAFILDFLKKGISSGLTDNRKLSDEILNDIHSGLTGSVEQFEHFIRFLLAMDNKYTQEAALKLNDFLKPVLIIWAKNDQYQPISVGEKLRDIFSNVIWKTIEGQHFHPFESLSIAESIYDWDKYGTK
jgi:2-hydroxymuconate-semialdehyde hydrolase